MDMLEFPRHCGCGCGTPINRLLAEIVEAKRFGSKNRQIAERLGCSVAQVKIASRQIAHFALGHSGRVAQFESRVCIECGAPFRIRSTATREYCRRKACVSGTAAYYQATGGPERWDAREAAHQEQRRTSHAQTIGRIYAESREARARAKRAIRAGYVPGPNIPTLEDQLANCDAEIRALYDEQLKDARREQVQYGPSLDQRFDESDDGSWHAVRYGAVYFDREDDMGPYLAARGVGRKVRASA